VQALIRRFLEFYFLDVGRLSNNVNYCRLVLGPSSQNPPSAPTSVSFLITKKCNMQCVHCYNDSGEAQPGELGQSERHRIAHYLGRWGVRTVTLTGGEPLLSRDAVPVLRILASHGVHLKVSTNGWRLTPDFLELVDAGVVFQVNVSLDGASAGTHDTFRKTQGSYMRVLSALSALRAANVRILNLNVAVHHRNLIELDAICDLARQCGVNSVSLKPVLMTGRATPEPGVLLTNADVEQFRTLRNDLRRRYGHLFNLSGTLVATCLPEEEEDRIDCFAAHTAMFIASNGDLLPCENLYPFLDVANTETHTPIQAWLQHDSFTRYRSLLSELRAGGRQGCSGCPAVGLHRRPAPIRLKDRTTIPLTQIA
jgi:MoaA/NifB/PqqE/SkfB family radical SAM enzyme